MKAKQIWEETSKRLEKVYDKREAESIAYLLLEDLYGLKREDIIVGNNRGIAEDLLSKAVDRLLQNEPVQYITGVTYFYGRIFKVGRGVLIPRPETEELVDLIIKENDISRPKVLDIGVGSGCIAITLALEIGGEVIGTDNSAHAISLASGNASFLKASVGLEKRDILQDDFNFSELDIVVSNPPYIPESDRSQMHANVLDYEPDEALFVTDDDPLLFYRKIGTRAREALKVGGKLYFEIHERFGIEVKDLLEKLDYGSVKIHQDMQGKDRIISAISSASK